MQGAQKVSKSYGIFNTQSSNLLSPMYRQRLHNQNVVAAQQTRIFWWQTVQIIMGPKLFPRFFFFNTINIWKIAKLIF